MESWQTVVLLLDSDQLRDNGSAGAGSPTAPHPPSRRSRGALPAAQAPCCRGRGAGPGPRRSPGTTAPGGPCRRPARRLSGSRAGAGARRPRAGAAGCARGAPVASPARDGAALAGRGLRPAARMELSSAEAASTRFLGLTQRYRSRGGGGRARAGRGAGPRCLWWRGSPVLPPAAGLEEPPQRRRGRLTRGGAAGRPSGSGAAAVPAPRPPPLGAAAGGAGGAPGERSRGRLRSVLRGRDGPPAEPAFSTERDAPVAAGGGLGCQAGGEPQARAGCVAVVTPMLSANSPPSAAAPQAKCCPVPNS